MANYPDWVKQFKRRGTAIKKVGNMFYLYKRSSHRVPGKKYPQVTEQYIGIITPEGVIENSKRKVTTENIEVFEYGFSKAMLQLCPELWRKPLKDNWNAVLKAIIMKCSDNSYLIEEKEEKEEIMTGVNLDIQMKKFIKLASISIDELLTLKTIYLIKFEEKAVVSKISESQRKILDKYNIDLECDKG